MAGFSRIFWSAVLCVACSASREPEPDVIVDYPAWFSPSPPYSAYDGEHEYQVTIGPSLAALHMDVDLSTVRGTFDESFVSAKRFEPMPGTWLLTTKKPGQTSMKMTFRTVDGREYVETQTLFISAADPEEWEQGNQRYEHGQPLRLEPMAVRADGTSSCGLVAEDFERLPHLSTSACAGCHEPGSGLFTSTPLLTAYYDDQQLIDMFAHGQSPFTTYRTPFMQMVSQPDCVFRAFHSWGVTPEEELGVVWKLRSLKLHLGAQY